MSTLECILFLNVRNIIIIPVKPPKTNILVAITTAEWSYLGAGGLPVVTTLNLNINADSRILVFVDGTVTITLGITACTGLSDNINFNPFICEKV
jgi:hypothetical protein